VILTTKDIRIIGIYNVAV